MEDFTSKSSKWIAGVIHEDTAFVIPSELLSGNLVRRYLDKSDDTSSDTPGETQFQASVGSV